MYPASIRYVLIIFALRNPFSQSYRMSKGMPETDRALLEAVVEADVAQARQLISQGLT